MKNKLIKSEMSFKVFILLLSFITVFVYAYSVSPLTSDVVGFDSAYFQYCGKAMLNGKMIYTDLFDNKGPLLYIFQLLFARLGGRYAIFVFLVILSSINYFLIDKIIAKFGNNQLRLRISVLLTSFLLLSITIQDGNLTEDYCLTISVFSLYTYLSLSSDRSKNISFKSSFIFGIAFSFCVLMRPTNAYFVCALMLAYFINSLLDKNSTPSVMLLNAVIFLIGVLALLLPVCVFYFVNGNFKDMIYAAYVFSFRYAIAGSINYRLGVLIPYTIFGILSIALNIKNRCRIVSIIFVLMASYIYVSLGFSYLHYYELLIPAWILFCVYIFDSEKTIKTSTCIISMVLIFLLNFKSFCVATGGTVCMVVKNSPFFDDTIVEKVIDRAIDAFNVDKKLYQVDVKKDALEIYELIPKEYRNKIYTTSHIWLLSTECYSDYKYIVTPDMYIDISGKIKDEISDIFENKRPPYVVAGEENGSLIDGYIKDFYKLILQNDNFYLYSRV